MRDARPKSQIDATGRGTAARGLLLAAALFAAGLTGPATLLPGSTATAQPSATYPDDSVAATDGLSRIAELAETGNLAEAARVVQALLDNEGDKVVEVSPGGQRFVGVRRRVHDLMLATPALLERYRLIESARAQKLLESGDIEAAEQTRLLTPAGLDAALTLAQREMEGARFEAARLRLEQFESHPDRKSDRSSAVRAARLVRSLARYLPRATVAAIADRWAADAERLGGEAVAPGQPVEPPAAARASAFSPLHPARAVDPGTIPTAPVQAVSLTDASAESRSEDIAWRLGGQPARASTPTAGDGPLVFPVGEGDTVFVNDGARVSALDRDTLASLWSFSPRRGTAADIESVISMRPGFSRKYEDIVTVGVGGGVVVAPMGFAINGARAGDPRVLGLDARTGATLWSVTVPRIDPGLSPGAVRGPVIIDGDSAVLTIRKLGRGTLSVHLAALDLYTGATRWVRTIASVGRLPWLQIQRRADATVLHEGVLYRGDEIGVVSAHESATGRPIWVHRLSPERQIDSRRPADQAPPFAISTVIIDGEMLVIHEPGPNGAILKLSRATGEVVSGASRPAAALGDPTYLVEVGEYLAAIGRDRVAFVKTSELADGAVKLSPPGLGGEFVGRAIAAGGKLMLPVGDGVITIDPADPASAVKSPMEGAGNLLAAGGHLLAADTARVGSYITWEQARSLLNARIKADPNNIASMLTFIELAYRAGQPGEIPALAESAAAVLERTTTPEHSAEPQKPERRRLFEVSLAIVREAGAGRSSVQLDTVSRLLRVLDRVGETAEERLSFLLELGASRSVNGDITAAIEAYQEILADATLGSARPLATVVPPTPIAIEAAATDASAGATGATAGEIIGSTPRPRATPAGRGPGREQATSRILELTQRHGLAPYAAFDEEASRATEQLPAAAPLAAMQALAQRYPLARSTPVLWRRIAAEHAKQGRGSEAASALGAGLIAAESLNSAGATDQAALISELGGELIVMLKAEGRAASAYRLLKRLATQYPMLELRASGSVLSGATLREELRQESVRAGSLARLTGAASATGFAVSPAVRLLPGWQFPEAGTVSTDGPTDCLMLESPLESKTSLFIIGPEDGELRPAWSRSFGRVTPWPVLSTLDDTLLFWPGQRAGFIEAIDNATGQTRWKTTEFGELFAGEPSTHRGDERFITPAAGEVRAGDLIVSHDATTVVLVERGGRAACFNLADGALAWKTTLPIPRVFDIAGCADVIVIAGSEEPVQEGQGLRPEGGVPEPRVIAIDRKTGSLRADLAKLAGGAPASKIVGDHVRWIRRVHDARTASGDAGAATAGIPNHRTPDRVVLGVGDGVVCVDAATLAPVWSRRGEEIPNAPRNPAFGTVLGGSLFVIDADREVYVFDIGDGRPLQERVDTRRKLELPATVTPAADRLIISGRPGLLIYNESGALVGTDLTDENGWTVAPVAGAELLVGAISRQGAGVLQTDRGRNGQHQIVDIVAVSARSGAMVSRQPIALFDEPRGIMLLDGKIIMQVGPMIVALDVLTGEP